jgi:hypothetical protein
MELVIGLNLDLGEKILLIKDVFDVAVQLSAPRGKIL